MSQIVAQPSRRRVLVDPIARRVLVQSGGPQGPQGAAGDGGVAGEEIEALDDRLTAVEEQLEDGAGSVGGGIW